MPIARPTVVAAALAGLIGLQSQSQSSPRERTLVEYDFTATAQGWSVSGDTRPAEPIFHPSGGSPGGHISHADEAVGETWYFRAPDSVLKQLAAAEHGTLSYSLKQSTDTPGFLDDDVIIVGPAGRLSFRFSTSPGTDWTPFSVKLTAAAGWRWNWNARATQEQIHRVLANPTSLEIRGEYLTGPDEGALDNVVLRSGGSFVPQMQTRTAVLENVRIIDGTGAPPIENGRVVIDGDRIMLVGPAAAVTAPPGAERIDLAGRTAIPGLIDLHFHIENDPKLALRQLSHGVTAFRDPGQWNDKFDELRRMIATDNLPGPRIFTTGPHIDGEYPAYPADSVVARDPEEARRQAEISVQQGASALKIYFRLPFASAKAVIDVCQARRIPCTAHLELLDAGELIAAGLQGIEHITSLGLSVTPRREAEAYRQAVLKDNDARREGRYRNFAAADFDGPEARALYAVLRERKPWVDATLAVFERRADRRPADVNPAVFPEMISGFLKMKQLTRRVAQEGARVVVGGHTSVPFASRGEAPWRELELLVESGFTPLEAVTAATGTAADFLYRSNEFGRLRPGLKADVVVLRGDPSRDIAAVRLVDRVMIDGRWIDPIRYRKY